MKCLAVPLIDYPAESNEKKKDYFLATYNS